MTQSAADCHDVEPGRDQRRGMAVTQAMEGDPWQTESACRPPPIAAERVRRVGPADRPREHEIVIVQSALSEEDPLLALFAAMDAQDIDHIVRQTDRSMAVARFRLLEAKPLLGLFQAALDPHGCAI